MKRRIFLKRIAPILVIFCIFATVLPTTTVLAASKITLKSGAAVPSTIYAGHTYSLKVSGTKVKFYSSNKKVATVGATTGKLKALAPGRVKITAKSTRTGKAVATKTFTVNQRAKSISLDQTECCLQNVGDTAEIKATLDPTTSTDVIRFSSSDKTVASVGVTSGKITAKGQGHCVIKAYAKATKATSNSSKYNKIATVDVYVGAYIESVEQDVDHIFIKFKGDGVPDTKPSDYTVTNDVTRSNVLIKSVSEENGKVVLRTYSQLKDSKPYTVHYGKSSGKFISCDGKIAGFRVVPNEISAGVETAIQLQLMTERGLAPIVSTDVGDSNNGYPDLESYMDVTHGYGYVSGNGNKLWLEKEGDTAEVTATYHTYKYENGKEVGAITKKMTITAKKGEAPLRVQNLYYTYSGFANDYVTILFDKDLPSSYKPSASKFTLAAEDATTVTPSNVTVSGNRITLTVPSSNLMNGKTYQVKTSDKFLTGTDALGSFTVSKYIYYPPVIDDTYKATSISYEQIPVPEKSEGGEPVVTLGYGVVITLNKPLPEDITPNVGEFEIENTSIVDTAPLTYTPKSVSLNDNRSVITLEVIGLGRDATHTVKWNTDAVKVASPLGEFKATLKPYTAEASYIYSEDVTDVVTIQLDRPFYGSLDPGDFSLQIKDGENLGDKMTPITVTADTEHQDNSKLFLKFNKDVLQHGATYQVNWDTPSGVIWTKQDVTVKKYKVDSITYDKPKLGSQNVCEVFIPFNNNLPTNSVNVSDFEIRDTSGENVLSRSSLKNVLEENDNKTIKILFLQNESNPVIQDGETYTVIWKGSGSLLGRSSDTLGSFTVGYKVTDVQYQYETKNESNYVSANIVISLNKALEKIELNKDNFKITGSDNEEIPNTVQSVKVSDDKKSIIIECRYYAGDENPTLKPNTKYNVKWNNNPLGLTSDVLGTFTVNNTPVTTQSAAGVDDTVAQLATA